VTDANDFRRTTRRQFFGVAAGGVALTSVGSVARAAIPVTTPRASEATSFFGLHQAGIATPQQTNVYFAAFDLTAKNREELIELFTVWTTAAERLSRGESAVEGPQHDDAEPLDSGEAAGSSPHRLTLTFGLGTGVFMKDGVDRYGLASRRPEAFIDLPRFNGDQLIAERTGGDLCVQACADDPQIAFHAVRQLARIADSKARLRWAQNGFLPRTKPKETPRNLMGFKDGTMNVPVDNPEAMSTHVWVGEEGGWMQHGSYLVVRPIRIALEHWDRMKLSFQEQVVGRSKQSGAPLGATHEFDRLPLERTNADGELLIPESSHVRLAAPETNDGAQVLRRGYSYDNGLSFVAERWPPWRQGMEFDAGLLFACFQRDPRTGFVKIFDKMSKFDMMNQFTTAIGGGMFAILPGVRHGGVLGQTLWDDLRA
jgi:deferrochelatase/peroxidase EfeB